MEKKEKKSFLELWIKFFSGKKGCLFRSRRSIFVSKDFTDSVVSLEENKVEAKKKCFLVIFWIEFKEDDGWQGFKQPSLPPPTPTPSATPASSDVFSQKREDEEGNQVLPS